ncbi:MAG: tRNA (N(6)-L-threonylcarbamoyladenosine(37)-C(2))-methylthiotransferase MtaB [Actinobacteria bacterium]|nr:tRNA (N(6)-L-threonylcarbamoyladenosine(37)-C(2))-methylthiotransferase MtaB [Actinomycetota bacterium]
MFKTVSFYTLGCRLNQAETAIIRHSFEQQGYDVLDFGAPTDLVVINTCTVTENGDADTRRLVNKVQRINSDARIALVGCQAQTQGAKLLQMPGVQWVIGNAIKMDLVNILNNLSTDDPQVMTPIIKKESFTIPIAGIDRNHTRANLKIQDGCDFFCSFCEIPYARGRARSREFNDILRAAKELVDAGHHELVLTGINVGTYRFEDKTISDVISALERIDGLLRLRISSIEPTTISDKIIESMTQQGKLCRYLHVPIQHGHDEILQAMDRKYSVQDFSEFILDAHNKIQDVCLGTDIMVGFPGETKAHFDATYELLRELPFTYFHVFSYSDRNHNKSRKFGEKVSKEIIDERSRRMRELSNRKRRTYLEGFLGKIEWVLFEQKKRGFWSGLTDTYIRVNATSNLDLSNKFLPVKLETIDNQAMAGTIQ